MRVLVAEDEPLIADAVAEWLRREAFAVDVAYDGDAALERLGINEYDGSCRTGTCPGCTATRCAGRWSNRVRPPGS